MNDDLFLNPVSPFPSSRSIFNDDLNRYITSRGRPDGLRHTDDFHDAYMLDTYIGQHIASKSLTQNFQALDIDLTPIPNFNPYEDADLENYPIHIFLGSRSPGEVEFQKRLYDDNNLRRERLDQSEGISGRIFANLADPINIIPIPFARAATFGKGFKGLATAGFATFAPFEIARADIDPTSTFEESGIAIGGATVLAGVLGGAIGGLSGRQLNKLADSYFAGHTVVDAVNELNTIHPNAVEGIAPRTPGAPLKDWILIREGETPEVYEARLLEIEGDDVMFQRYAAISDSYAEGSSLIETGIGFEKVRLTEHPWLFLKNTKFGGILGNRIRRLADEIAGSPGMYNKGNEDLQSSAQSAHARALLHNVALVNFNRRMIDGFLMSEGIDPQNANRSDFGRALGAMQRSLPGVKAGLRQKEFDDDVASFYMDPRDTSIIHLEGKKDAYIDSVKEAAEGIREYMEYMARQGMETGIFGPRMVKNQIKKLEEQLKTAQEHAEKYKLRGDSPEKRAANDFVSRKIKELDEKRNYLTLLEEANKRGELPKTKSEIGLGHWPIIWRAQEVEARRDELIARLESFYKEEGLRSGKLVGERVDETIGRILGQGEFSRLVPVLKKMMRESGVEDVSAKKWIDGFEALVKHAKAKAPVKSDLQLEVLNAVAPFLKRFLFEVKGENLADDFVRGLGKVKDEPRGGLSQDLQEIKKVLRDIEEMIADSNSGNFGVSVNALSRKINIPPHLVKDFIETDPNKVMRLYHRRMAVSIEMGRRFDGDPTMGSEIEALSRMMDDQIKHATGKERETLIQEKEKAIQAIEDLRDKVLGVYRIPRDPSALDYRATQFTKHWMALSLMGQPIIASLADLGKVQMALGWKQMFGAAWSRATTGKEAFRLAGDEARLAGIGSDVATRMRFENLMDFDDFYTPMSKLEEFTARNVDRLFFVNLLTPYTDYLKVFTGSIMQSNIIKTSEKVVNEGVGSLSRTEKLWIARSGLGEDELRGIYAQWQKAGSQKDDIIYLANTNKWTDTNLQRRFRTALATEVENAVITPGPNTRLNFMSTNTGSIVTQFKNFALTATHQITMAGLQQRDMYTLQALSSMIAIGAFVDL